MRKCLECGGEVKAEARREAEFCCDPCRKAFNNRRALRGAELYDLFMSQRFDRANAGKQGAWTVMCSLASAYRDADKTKRQGRRSWRKLGAALDGIPAAFGASGDRR
jgi:hypothetical protein